MLFALADSKSPGSETDWFFPNAPHSSFVLLAVIKPGTFCAQSMGFVIELRPLPPKEQAQNKHGRQN